MQYWYYTTDKLDQDGERVHYLGIARTPTFWAAWETVCEWACTHIFRDRWCNHIAGPAMTAAEKRTERFETVPVPTDWMERYHAWRGMSCWWIDDEEDDD